MAWTTPKSTWKTAELVTAAGMNTYLRDNLKCVGDHLTWSTWAPALAITSGTTAPNLGNAGANPIRSGSWMRLGTTVSGLVHASCQVRFGTSGIAAGTGIYTISLPVTMSSSDTARQQVLGGGAIYDASGADTHHVIAVQHSSAVCKLKYTSTASTENWVTNAAPFTWASSDQIHLNLHYEIR
jgi:hypothetical protein